MTSGPSRFAKPRVHYRTKFVIGRVAEELMRAAHEEQATLIVIGMTARGTLSELVLGSTQHELLHHAVAARRRRAGELERSRSILDRPCR